MGNLLRKQKASWSVFNRDSLISIQGREILLLVVKTGAVLGVLNYFFYREWWAFVLLIPVGVLYFRLECGNLIRCSPAFSVYIPPLNRASPTRSS